MPLDSIPDYIPSGSVGKTPTSSHPKSRKITHCELARLWASLANPAIRYRGERYRVREVLYQFSALPFADPKVVSSLRSFAFASVVWRSCARRRW